MHIRLLEDDPALREALVVALSDCGVAVMPEHSPESEEDRHRRPDPLSQPRPRLGPRRAATPRHAATPYRAARRAAIGRRDLAARLDGGLSGQPRLAAAHLRGEGKKGG